MEKELENIVSDKYQYQKLIAENQEEYNDEDDDAIEEAVR
jgi:hypothetical protein